MIKNCYAILKILSHILVKDIAILVNSPRSHARELFLLEKLINTIFLNQPIPYRIPFSIGHMNLKQYTKRIDSVILK